MKTLRKPSSATVSSGKNNFILAALVGVSILLSFTTGILWVKVDTLEKLSSPSAVFVSDNGAEIQDAVAPAEKGELPEVNEDLVERLSADDNVRGNPDARIQLIVYSCPECPFSKRFHTTSSQILTEYKDEIALVYRHFPLDQIHPTARKKAEGLECAAKLAGNEGFWKLADRIYDETVTIIPDNSTLPELASQLGMNKTAFSNCLENGETVKTVEDSFQSGVKAGVAGTPGSFLIDTRTSKVFSIAGAYPLEQIRPTIEKILEN